MMRPDEKVEQMTEIIVTIINSTICEFTRMYPAMATEINTCNDPVFIANRSLQYAILLDNVLDETVSELDAKYETQIFTNGTFYDIIAYIDLTCLTHVYEELKRFTRKTKEEMTPLEIFVYNHAISKIAAELNTLGYFDEAILIDRYGNRKI